jgi:hypothetical protein
MLGEIMPRPMHHFFNGKKYTIQRVCPEQLEFDDLEEDETCYGICSNPDNKDRYIKIDNTLKGRRLLEVELHESIHGSNYRLSEKTVERMGKEVSDLLWKMGYRKVH